MVYVYLCISTYCKQKHIALKEDKAKKEAISPSQKRRGNYLALTMILDKKTYKEIGIALNTSGSTSLKRALKAFEEISLYCSSENITLYSCKTKDDLIANSEEITPHLTLINSPKLKKLSWPKIRILEYGGVHYVLASSTVGDAAAIFGVPLATMNRIRSSEALLRGEESKLFHTPNVVYSTKFTQNDSVSKSPGYETYLERKKLVLDKVISDPKDIFLKQSSKEKNIETAKRKLNAAKATLIVAEFDQDKTALANAHIKIKEAECDLAELI